MRVNSKQVLLSWQTLSEQGNNGFELERKFDIDTGYIDIVFIATNAMNGNSVAQLNYFYEDTPIYKGVIMYRLKQMSRNGTPGLSNITTIAPINIKMSVDISPNLSYNAIYFSTNNTDAYYYELVDINGRRLIQGSFYGNHSHFYVADISRGMYYLRLGSMKSGETLVKEVMIIH